MVLCSQSCLEAALLHMGPVLEPVSTALGLSWAWSSSMEWRAATKLEILGSLFPSAGRGWEMGRSLPLASLMRVCA